MEFRSPSPDEARLLRALATLARIADPEAWVDRLRVREMDDGGMGSLAFDVPIAANSDRKQIICRAAVQFTDADGVEVIASLNAGEDAVPFELDMWKTDFSQLVSIPHEFRLLEEQPTRGPGSGST